MKTHRFPWFAAAAAATLVVCTAPARATEVSWSVGINAPIGPGVAVGTVISNRHMAPVAVVPAPVVHVPAPAVYVPAPVYAPAPVHAPRRVVYGEPVWVAGRWLQPEHHPQRLHDAPRWREHDGHDGYGRRPPPQYVPSRMPGREIRH